MAALLYIPMATPAMETRSNVFFQLFTPAKCVKIRSGPPEYRRNMRAGCIHARFITPAGRIVVRDAGTELIQKRYLNVAGR